MAGSTLKSVAVFVAIALLGVLAWLSLAHGWADLLALQGRATLQVWDARPNSPAAEARDRAQDRLQRALANDPGNPAIAEDLGRLHELRSRALPAGDPAAAAELNRALDYLSRSLRQRPTSPYTWANFAFVKSRLGVPDAEFLRAIDRAAILGPWEPEVQLTLADIGFRYWSRLPQATRQTIHQVIHRGLKRQDGKLFEMAARYGRLDIMCATPGVARSKLALRCI